jgi:hypothetical protein
MHVKVYDGSFFLCTPGRNRHRLCRLSQSAVSTHVSQFNPLWVKTENRPYLGAIFHTFFFIFLITSELDRISPNAWSSGCRTASDLSKSTLQ